MMNRLMKKSAGYCGLVLGFTMIATGAQATVITSESNAYALGVDLSVEVNTVAVAQASLTLPSMLQQTAPGAYDMSNTAISVDASVGATFAGLQDADVFASTGVFNGQITSDVDGGNGSRMTTGYSEVNGLGSNVFDTTFPLDLSALLSVNSTTLNSYSEVSGDWGSFTAVGSSIIEDLSIFFLGSQVDLLSEGITADVLAGSTPNFQLIDFNGIAGLDLILNEQNSTCSMSGFCSMEVNALRFAFEGVSLLDAGIDGLINGELIIGHSYAEMTGMPTAPVNAPAALGMLLMATAISVMRARR